jgi:hypothetical protein
MMFSIVYFLKRRCGISAFPTAFLLWVVLWAQLPGEFPPCNYMPSLSYLRSNIHYLSGHRAHFFFSYLSDYHVP